MTLNSPDATQDRMRVPGAAMLGGSTRAGASVRFVFGAVWVIISQVMATVATHQTPYPWQEPLFRTLWLVLLLAGFWGMGRALDGQAHPIQAMGLMRREGFVQEWSLGVSVGWGAMVFLVLPMMLFGALSLTFWAVPRAFGLTLLNLLVLAIAALAEEVAFRGYAFQRLKDAVGPTMATILISVVFGLVHLSNPHAGGWAAITVTVLAGVMLSVAYLRTRSLWLAWGLHFGWNASMGLLFGLPVSGIDFSTLVQARPQPPVWLTGGLYGPEASALAPFVVVGAIIVLYRVTRDLAWKYGFDPIVAGGYAMDAPPPAAHTAMEASAKPAPLVQILPTTPQNSTIRRPGE